MAARRSAADAAPAARKNSFRSTLPEQSLPERRPSDSRPPRLLSRGGPVAPGAVRGFVFVLIVVVVAAVVGVVVFVGVVVLVLVLVAVLVRGVAVHLPPVADAVDDHAQDVGAQTGEHVAGAFRR